MNDDECPVCGEPYQNGCRLKRGTQWRDLYPGTCFDFFSKYDRTCHARFDAEREEALPPNEVFIYCHETQYVR